MGESVQHVQVWGEVENGDRDGEGAGEASMKLPASTNIAREKVTRYLRNQLLPLDAVPTKSDKFGQYYEIRGNLAGPSGKTLAVRAIWMTEHLSGVTKFVTPLPDKRKTG